MGGLATRHILAIILVQGIIAEQANFATDPNIWPVVLDATACRQSCAMSVGGSLRPFLNLTVVRGGMLGECRCVKVDSDSPCSLTQRRGASIDLSQARNAYNSPVAFCIQWKCERFCRMHYRRPGLCRRYYRLDSVRCVCYADQALIVEARPPPGAVTSKYTAATSEKTLQQEHGEVFNGALRCQEVQCNEYCNYSFGNWKKFSPDGWPPRRENRAFGQCRFYEYAHSNAADRRWTAAVMAFCACRVTQWGNVDISSYARDVAHVISQCHLDIDKREGDQSLANCNEGACNFFCGHSLRLYSPGCLPAASLRHWRCTTEESIGECRNITSWHGVEAPLDSQTWEWPEDNQHQQRVGCFCKRKPTASASSEPESLLTIPEQ